MISTRNNSKENEDNLKRSIEQRLEIYTNKIRFRIFLLLAMYGELSLTELSHHMKKSKPALYHHLQKMLDLEVIQVSREVPVRGSILAKYYALGEQGAQIFQAITLDQVQAISDPNAFLTTLKGLVEAFRSSVSMFRNILDLIDRSADVLENETRAVTDPQSSDLEMHQLISEYEIGVRLYHFTRPQYEKFLDYAQEFSKKIQTLIDETSRETQGEDSVVERPYCFLTLIAPVKRLLDLELE